MYPGNAPETKNHNQRKKNITGVFLLAAFPYAILKNWGFLSQPRENTAIFKVLLSLNANLLSIPLFFLRFDLFWLQLTNNNCL